jgi:hypothetical protein
VTGACGHNRDQDDDGNGFDKSVFHSLALHKIENLTVAISCYQRARAATIKTAGSGHTGGPQRSEIPRIVGPVQERLALFRPAQQVAPAAVLAESW